MPPFTNSARRNLQLTFLVALAMAASAGAAEDISTWQCLPEETVFAFRIPNGRAIADAFVKNTKLGAVIFSEKRRQVVAEYLSKTNSESWAKFKQKLTDYGLSTDDLLEFFAGESGYAVVISQGADGQPLPLGVSWFQPGEELAGRAYDVLARAIEEQEGSEGALGRVDLDLSGRPVMQIMIPHVSTEHTVDLEMPDGYDQMSDDEQQAAREQAYEAWTNSAVEKTSYSVALVSTIGSRVLIAHGYDTHESQDEHPEAEPVAEIFTRLLAEHDKGEGGFVTKLANDPGVSRVMSLEGVSSFESLGDFKTLLPLLRAKAGENSELAEKIIRIVGLECLGPVAVRYTLQGTRWHSQVAISAAQPRQGLIKLIDQEALPTDPPAWVPASIITYNQISFDLGKAYAVIKEEVTREFPDQAGQYFGLADMQVVGFAQSTVEDLLSSLGTRHVILNFETPLDSEAMLENQTESTAVVWQVTDEQIWTRVIQAITPMASTMPGAEATDEQGYNGIRFKNDEAEGGLFLGNGNLVVAYGPQVLESTLSALNNPPEGADAFRGGEVYRQASELLDAGPSMGFKVVDGNRYAKMLRNVLMQFAENAGYIRSLMTQEDISEEDLGENDSADADKELLKQLIPTDEEMENLLGVIVSRWEVNDDGLFTTTVQETPAP